ncbi:hypothetical protein LPN04_30995 [Rugamonas sp. A1-17]|nr:hypothetical protein [Rugamonas sp. A1-17]
MKIYDARCIETHWIKAQEENKHHIQENGPWQDDVDWYGLKYGAEQFTHVRIESGLYVMTKRGPGEKVAEDCAQ